MDLEPTYHFVPHVHWDREWMSGREESRVLIADFFAELFRMFAQDEDFTSLILDGHMALVEDHLAAYPEHREHIENLVHAGRLHVGPWYILADEFMPSGEALLRNLMIGTDLAMHCGTFMHVGWLPDQFGHIAQMPQILRGFAIDTAVMYRGFGGEPGQEHSEYRWFSPDGHHVLMFHLHADGYSFGYFMGDDGEGIRARFRRLRELTDPRARTRHRLILNGGDRHWPDARLTSAVRALRSTEGVDARVSSITSYITAVQECEKTHSLPKWHGESRFGLAHAFAVIGGTASARAWVKRENDACQVLLERGAEPLNAILAAIGGTSLTPHLRRAWMHLLENQDHDVLSGTCVDDTYRDVQQRFRWVRALCGTSVQLLLDDLLPVDPAEHGDDRILHFFNPLPRPRTEVVECTIDFRIRDVRIGINPDFVPVPDAPPVRGFALLDEQRRALTFQVLERGEAWAIIPNRHGYPHQTRVERFRLLVRVDLPACGFTRATIERRDAFPAFTPLVHAEGRTIGNGLVCVETSEDGSMAVTDLTKDIGFTDLNILEDGGDAGDCYSYCAPGPDRIITTAGTTPGIAVVESGPLRTVLEVRHVLTLPACVEEGEEGGSRSPRRSDRMVEVPVTVRHAVTADRPWVDVDVTIDNRARDHRLRAVFATGVLTRISTAGTPFAYVRRVHVERDSERYRLEKPMNLEVLQDVLSIGDDERALALFTRGVHEYELAHDGTGRLALTLLRCVGELSRGDLPTRPGGDAAWKHATPDAQCIGMQRAEYALMPHGVEESMRTVTRASERYRTPVMAFTRRHANEDVPFASFLRVESDHSAWSSLNEARDGSGFILRFYNPTTISDIVRIACALTLREVWISELDEYPREQRSMLDETIDIPLDPFEILTVRLVPA